MWRCENMRWKKDHPIRLLLFLLSLLNSVPLFCATHYAFKHYNINNGLSQNTVHAIFQDKLGFMWFGTKDGLNRFDGKSFKIFKFSPGENLGDNVFHRILQDKQDNLWVGTDDGIYIYNPRKESFKRFEGATSDHRAIDGVVSDLLEDNEGDIWISVEEKGVFHYNMVTGSLTNYHIPQSPDGMKMISLCLGEEGDIWVFPYNHPFSCIHKKNGAVTVFHLMDDPSLFYSTGEIWKVISDEYHQLLVASSTKGLISVNTVNRTHRNLLSEDANGQPIFVRCLAKVDAKTIWIGSESGLYMYHTDTEKAENLRHNQSIPYSLSDNAIYSIFKDREGGIWVGSFFGGVDYYSEQYNQFELFYPVDGLNRMKGCRVREFCEAPDGKIWIGTEDNGLNLFDPVKNEFLPLPSPLQSLYTNIHALCADGDYLWIGTFSKGLNRFNLKTNELVTFLQTDASASISQNSTFSICKDRQNILWVGNLSGLNIYDYEKNNFKQIDVFQGIFIEDIFEDADGKIWVATFTKGVYRYDPAKDIWKVFSDHTDNNGDILYKKVTSLFEDSKKQLWMATEGGGFSRFDRRNEEFIAINSSKGLPNDVVYQIREDTNGNLWLSTNSGLVRYQPQTGAFRSYTVENGLKTNQFNYQSSYKASDGTLYFGSIDGFVRFNPATFIEPEFSVPIVFTELYMNNVPVTPKDEKSLLKQSILFADKLTLPYRKNSFRLSYAVLNYANGNDYRILYKLDGFDKDWIPSESNSDIIYSNLSPGSYRLSLKLHNGSMNGGDETLKTLIIRVSPPFWISGWAYLSYAVLLVSGIVFLFRFSNYRNHKLQKERMRLFEQRKERELYRSKIDFFTHVAHEIRTPLSLIKAPLDYVMQREKVSEEVKENLLIMSKNTERLLSLTNQLLDFQKTEADAYLLNLNPENVSELMRETFFRFTPLAKQRAVRFEMEIPEEEMYLRVDKEAFLKIISNLMNNAVKYCDSFVKIKAYIERSGEVPWFHLIADNDGEKIPDDYKDAIFKPFIHLDKGHDRTVNGTGIGLALSRSLAELHKGILDLENTTDIIRFHLQLPVGNGEKEEKMSAAEISAKTIAISHTTILLVDDDPELLRFEEKFLSPHYHVLTAKNGKEALSVLKEQNVNLVVCDVMMPEMDGFEFTHRVKSDIEFSHIPVILLTAKVNVQSKVQGFEVGADAYIDKPFSLEVLLAQIANLLQNREKLRETFYKHPYIGVNSMALTKSDEAFINKLQAIVLENMDNSEFVVEDIAEQFNMSRASFYRKIKGVLNLTPNEYIRVERLKRAAQLLKENTYKVNEICYMVGFNSPSYFSKCFQQQFGVLPRDFE